MAFNYYNESLNMFGRLNDKNHSTVIKIKLLIENETIWYYEC